MVLSHSDKTFSPEVGKFILDNKNEFIWLFARIGEIKKISSSYYVRTHYELLLDKVLLLIIYALYKNDFATINELFTLAKNSMSPLSTISLNKKEERLGALIYSKVLFFRFQQPQSNLEDKKLTANEGPIDLDNKAFKR